MPYVASQEEGNNGEPNEKNMDNEIHTGVVWNCIGIVISLSISPTFGPKSDV